MTACVISGLWLAAQTSVQAIVLDDFDSAVRTGWTDTPNGGHLLQTGGQLDVTTAASTGALAYGTKTSQSYANAANQTLEFRVDVNAVTPGNGDPNPVAILAWLPNGAVPGEGSSGYTLSVSAGTATLQKGGTVLASGTYTADATNIQNTTLMIRMTPSGSSLSVNARVYRQTGSLPMQNFTEVWETTQTVSDSIGTPGYAAVGVKSGSSASGATVYFDNLQVFPLATTVLDDFSGGTSDLANYSLSGYGTVTISGGQMDIATIYYNGTIYEAARRTTPNYIITDGSRLEISVDWANNVIGYDPEAFSALSYTPANNDSGVSSLLGYHIGAGQYGLSLGKAYSEWWVNQKPYPYLLNTGSPIPAGGVRLKLNMTGEGTSVRIESRIEDLNVGANDPDRVLFQNVFVDTEGVDPLDTTDSPNNPDGTGIPFGPIAYQGVPGSIVLYAFYGGSAGSSEVQYTNLVVSQTAPANLPPAFNNLVPADGANFVSSSTSVSFVVNDDVDTPVDNISLKLDGVLYTNGSPGVTISGTSQNRVFTLAGPLLPDTFYNGSIEATDDVGSVSVLKYSFDTFSSACYVVEAEDYNFNSGSFIDNPVVMPDGSAASDTYVNQIGTVDVDYHDNRNSPSSSSTYRYLDYPETAHTGDGPRQKYIDAGAPETVVVDLRNGDWMNYTHNYPAGYYNAYIRMAQYNLSRSLVLLESVSDPTITDPATNALGAFIGGATGYDLNRNALLTDAFGQPVLVHFPGGAATVRLRNVSVEGTDAELGLNYVVFAPATSPGALPPFVATVSPLPGTVLGASGAPSYSATIVNRDSSVDTGSVIVQINDVTVPSSVTPNTGGATLTWTPLGTTAVFTNAIIFKDNLNVWQTNTWTYTYTGVLRATNSLPVGSLSVRGFESRMVQSDNDGATLENSLNRALQQLAIPPLIPIDRTATSMVQVLNWNKTSDVPNNVPGLCPGSYINIAVDSLAYLELTPGVHRFRIQTDDRAGLYAGAGFADPKAVAMWENPGNTADAMFDFVVEAAGLYPVRCIWEETGGGANLNLWSVDLSDGSQVLINDPANPAGVVKAWYPVVCKSSSSVTGPYTAATGAVNVLNKADIVGTDCGTVVGQIVTSGTFTIPMSGTAQFYYLDGPRNTSITSISLSGQNVVITYQVQ